MKLWSFWRSTTSFRVRAALGLKGVPFETLSVNLLKHEQLSDTFGAISPGRGVPALGLEDGRILTQSMAVLDYIEATWPEPPILPSDPVLRARVLSAAHTVALDIHPANNLRLLAELRSRFGATEDQIRDWMHHWMRDGFTTLEAQLNPDTEFSFGAAPDVCDLCVTGQTINAHRFGLDLAPWPKVRRVEAACLQVPAIVAALPENQPDAEPAP